MKTLYQFAIASCMAIALVSCKKETPEPPVTPTPSSYGFLKEGFVFTYGELVSPDSNVYESYEKQVMAKNSSGKYFANTTITSAADSTQTYQEIYNYDVKDGILISDGYPINVLNPVLNQVYTYNEYTIKCIAQNVSVTTEKGTFLCNRFDVTYNGFLDTGILCDMDYKYPFIRFGEYYNGEPNPRFFINLINNK